jgi:hypothetical protein
MSENRIPNEPKPPLKGEAVLNPPAETMWTLEDALLLIQAIQEAMYPHGYCVALGGGVLNNGFSAHDLVIVPLGLWEGYRNALGVCSAFEKHSHESMDQKYAFAFQEREQQGETTLVRYFDFHTEKLVELRFIGETNIWQ